MDAESPNRAARSFFLATTPETGRPELTPEDQEHARRVLRLGAGDPLWGLDGQGGRWPLRVSDVTGGGLEVEATGAVSREPAPGEPGASIPWIELAVALPREKRAEVMLDRLVQLGLAALTPLWTGRSQGPRRDLSASRRRRLERAAREACKQSGRTWLPVLNPTHSPDELAASREGTSVALLSPDEGMVLPHWAGRLDEGLGTRLEPIVLVVGPEGGFTDDEARRLTEGGARRVRLGPHTLRVETAAEAAVGGLVQTLFRP